MTTSTIKPPSDLRRKLNGLPDQPPTAQPPHVTEIGRAQHEAQVKAAAPDPVEPYDGLVWKPVLDRPPTQQRENMFLQTTHAAEMHDGILLRIGGPGGSFAAYLPGMKLEPSKHKPTFSVIVKA